MFWITKKFSKKIKTFFPTLLFSFIKIAING